MATANLLQTSVSGGTQNALSLQGDGVFFPKASTASRLALTLTTTDKGFIVYDTTDNNIYFWNGTAWESIPGSGDAGANGSVQYNDNGLVSGATTFVYDKATGNVGVGIPSPFGDAGYKSIDLRGTTGGEVVLGSTSVREATITGDGTNGMTLNTINATPLRFFTQGVERARFNSAGNLAFVSGKGIDFSAVTGGTGTATANVLNDYEEGTWTGTLKGSTTDPTIPVTATGRYTKVGRQVSVQIQFAGVSNIGASGRISITGLPFVNSGFRTIGTAGAFTGATFTGTLISVIDFNISFIELIGVISNSSWNEATHNTAASTYFWANVTYTV